MGCAALHEASSRELCGQPVVHVGRPHCARTLPWARSVEVQMPALPDCQAGQALCQIERKIEAVASPTTDIGACSGCASLSVGGEVLFMQQHVCC